MKKSEAKKILGSDFFGCKEIENTFNISISESNIPTVPFSNEDLRRAKKNNQFLILRINKTSDGELFTIEKIHSLLNGKLRDGSFALFRDYNASGERENSSWYQEEAFAIKDTPRSSWALVSKDVSRKITNHLRLKPVELIYDYCVYFQNTGKKLLQNADVITSCIDKSGMTIFVSDFPKQDGLYIGLTKENRPNPRMASYISITKS